MLSCQDIYLINYSIVVHPLQSLLGTGVCTMQQRQSLIASTVCITFTLSCCPASTASIKFHKPIKVPVRPTPALSKVEESLIPFLSGHTVCKYDTTAFMKYLLYYHRYILCHRYRILVTGSSRRSARSGYSSLFSRAATHTPPTQLLLIRSWECTYFVKVRIST